MTPFTPPERSLLNSLLLHARGTGDAEAFALLTRLADDPDGFRELVDSYAAVKTESAAGKVKKTGTDKSGHKYTRWVNPDTPGPGGKDGDPRTTDHPPELAAKAAGELKGLPDEVKANPGLMARLGDALLTVAAKVNLAALKNNERIMAAVSLAEAVFDTPDDLKTRFGYNPTTTAGGDGAPTTADPIRQATGLSTHLACTIASHVLGRLSVWAKHRARGEAEQDGPDWAGLAEVISGVFLAVNDALGLEGAPDAAAIEAKLVEMFAS